MEGRWRGGATHRACLIVKNGELFHIDTDAWPQNPMVMLLFTGKKKNVSGSKSSICSTVQRTKKYYFSPFRTYLLNSPSRMSHLFLTEDKGSITMKLQKVF